MQERYLVSPAQIIELKALMGDPADNIPGIPGVGEKTAIRLLVEYGSIENAFPMWKRFHKSGPENL